MNKKKKRQRPLPPPSRQTWDTMKCLQNPMLTTTLKTEQKKKGKEKPHTAFSQKKKGGEVEHQRKGPLTTTAGLHPHVIAR